MEKQRIGGQFAAIRAHSTLIMEDIPQVLEMEERALSFLPAGDEMRFETGGALGGAY
jgi:hypothetical protein